MNNETDNNVLNQGFSDPEEFDELEELEEIDPSANTFSNVNFTNDASNNSADYQPIQSNNQDISYDNSTLTDVATANGNENGFNSFSSESTDYNQQIGLNNDNSTFSNQLQESNGLNNTIDSLDDNGEVNNSFGTDSAVDDLLQNTNLNPENVSSDVQNLDSDFIDDNQKDLVGDSSQVSDTNNKLDVTNEDDSSKKTPVKMVKILNYSIPFEDLIMICLGIVILLAIIFMPKLVHIFN